MLSSAVILVVLVPLTASTNDPPAMSVTETVLVAAQAHGTRARNRHTPTATHTGTHPDERDAPMVSIFLLGAAYLALGKFVREESSVAGFLRRLKVKKCYNQRQF